MKKPFLRLALTSLFVVGGVGETLTQSAGFSLPWSTLDGGGGWTGGDSYAINGTIGQPDAGEMSGGAFAISGGFWSGVVLGPEPEPRLAIRRVGSDVVLSWPHPSTGYVLQQTINMSGPGGGWTEVTSPPTVVGPNREVTIQAAGQFCLFRLRQP